MIAREVRSLNAFSVCLKSPTDRSSCAMIRAKKDFSSLVESALEAKVFDLKQYQHSDDLLRGGIPLGHGEADVCLA